MGGDSEVCPSVVEAVVIDVVDDHSGRYFDDAAVHKVGEARFVGGAWAGALGIPGAGGLMLDGVPFVPAQTRVVLGVDDCVLTSGEGYSAKGVAVAEPTIGQTELDQRPRQP